MESFFIAICVVIAIAGYLSLLLNYLNLKKPLLEEIKSFEFILANISVFSLIFEFYWIPILIFNIKLGIDFIKRVKKIKHLM